MISLFIKWLTDVCQIEKKRIDFSIYIHENSFNAVPQVKLFWSKITEFPLGAFEKVYFKKNKISTNRTNVGHLYYGLLRVKVNASSDLNRRLSGWVKGICKNCGVV